MAHIIQVTTFFHPIHGGVEQQVLDLSKQLAKKGHTVEVICSDSTRTKKRIKEKYGEIDGIKITRCRTWFSFSHFYKIYPKLFFLLLKRKFDIVHVHGFRKFEIYPALLAAKLKGKKIVVTTHNPFFTTSRNKLLQICVNIHDQTLGKIFTCFIDKIICLTNIEVQFVEKFNVNKEKIFVIPNGIRKEIFKKGDPKVFFKKYQIPTKEFKHIVLWTGRIHEVKGLENLETAVKQLENVLFVFAGPNDNASEKIKDLYKNSNNVIFTGRYKNEDIVHAHAASDLFVLPSLHEAFGIVLLEAMAQGRPVISTNIGGPSEIVKSEFGILQDPSDQWAWMLNIEKILNNKKLREHMSQSAIKEARKYRWSRLIDLVLNLYGV